MAVSVTIFNASSQSIAAMVNQGPQFSIPGTGPAQNWQPQSSASGAGPSFSPGYPSPNVLGTMGQNTIMFLLNGSPIGGRPFTFSLPNNLPIGSVQIFVFFSPQQSATLVVLTDGMLVSQQVIGGMEGQAPAE